jgi:hypothetical protein
MHSLSLETRRHYLAPDREESQLWKSWKSAPDGFFGVTPYHPTLMVAPEDKKISRPPRRLAAENGLRAQENSSAALVAGGLQHLLARFGRNLRRALTQNRLARRIRAALRVYL